MPLPHWARYTLLRLNHRASVKDTTGAHARAGRVGARRDVPARGGREVRGLPDRHLGDPRHGRVHAFGGAPPTPTGGEGGPQKKRDRYTTSTWPTWRTRCTAGRSSTTRSTRRSSRPSRAARSRSRANVDDVRGAGRPARGGEVRDPAREGPGAQAGVRRGRLGPRERRARAPRRPALGGRGREGPPRARRGAPALESRAVVLRGPAVRGVPADGRSRDRGGLVHAARALRAHARDRAGSRRRTSTRCGASRPPPGPPRPTTSAGSRPRSAASATRRPRAPLPAARAAGSGSRRG